MSAPSKWLLGLALTALMALPHLALAISDNVPVPFFKANAATTQRPTSTGTASTTARIIAIVTPSTAISKTSDMRFKDQDPGAPAATVSHSDPANAAAVLVSGSPNQAYNLALPEAVELRTSESAPGILVHDFTSSLPNACGAILPGSFWRQPTIGATRDGIPLSLPPGSYHGDMPVTVIYP